MRRQSREARSHAPTATLHTKTSEERTCRPRATHASSYDGTSDTRKGSTPSSYIWRCSSAELERTFTGQLRSVVRDAEVASAAAVASLTLAHVYRAGKLTWLREAR